MGKRPDKKQRKVYWEIGDRRVQRYYREEFKKGYHPIDVRNYGSGVDLFVFNDKWHLLRVYEITNYQKKKHYISIKRAKRYKNSLNEFNGVEQILVVSFKENLRYLPNDYLRNMVLK